MTLPSNWSRTRSNWGPDIEKKSLGPLRIPEQSRGISWSGTPGSNRRPSPWQRGSPAFTIRQEPPRISTILRFHSGLWIPIQVPVPRIFMRILKPHMPTVCQVAGRETVARRSTCGVYLRSLVDRPRTSTTSARAPSCHTTDTCRTRSGSIAGPSANRSGSVSKCRRRRVPATRERDRGNAGSSFGQRHSLVS
jgi:hypothetical protein